MTLYPGFAELNLNKKVWGAKKSNVLPVVTLEDAANLLSSVTLTPRMVVSILVNCMPHVDSGNLGNYN